MILQEEERFAPSNEMLAKALSMLGQSPAGHGCIFRKFSLPGQGIKDIRFLGSYSNVEFLELPCNAITDISVLSHLPFLYSVDLSANRISTFKLPENVHLNLQHLDLSRNQIISVAEIGVHRFLKHLCFDRNLIRQITGLESCINLSHLSIAHNAITSLSGLGELPLKYLDLSWNRIKDISETKYLFELEHLILHHNQIENLAQLSNNCACLSNLDLSSNLLSDLTELPVLSEFPSLKSLSISGNPYTGIPKRGLRAFIIFHLPELSIIDGLPSCEKEKVNSFNYFDPSPSIVQTLEHARETAEELRRFAILEAPSEKLDSLVLCGPEGVGKRLISQRLIQDFPHLFANTIPHTTRPPNHGEINGVDFYFVSNETMEYLKKESKFVSCISYGKHTTGLSKEACGRPAREGKMSIFRVDVNEAIALKQSGIVNARYIFLSPPNLKDSQVYLSTSSRRRLATPHIQSKRVYEPSKIMEYVDFWLNQGKKEGPDLSQLNDLFFECAIINYDFESCYALIKEVALQQLLSRNEDKYLAESNLDG